MRGVSIVHHTARRFSPGAARFSGGAYLGSGDATTLNVAGAGTPALLFGCWIKLHSKAAFGFLMGKWDSATAANHEYGLWYNASLDRLVAGRRDAFGMESVVIANTYGSPPLETWIHVGAKLSGGAVQWQIFVNGVESDFVLPGEAAGGNTGKSEFRIGLTADGAWPLEADIDDAFVMDDPFPVPDFSGPYNGGAGSAFAGLGSTLQADCKGWFNLDDPTTPGTRVDSVARLLLSPHGSVPAVAGKT